MSDTPSLQELRGYAPILVRDTERDLEQFAMSPWMRTRLLNMLPYVRFVASLSDSASVTVNGSAQHVAGFRCPRLDGIECGCTAFGCSETARLWGEGNLPPIKTGAQSDDGANTDG